MKRVTLVSVFMLCGACATASAGIATAINGVVDARRTFNDFPSSTLNIVNNYPTSVSISEGPFGVGGFANRHIFFYSSDAGATRTDFDYADAFDLCIDVDLNGSNLEGREAGFQADLFGFGFFGVLPNGEVAAFGSILPFHSFGLVGNPDLPTHLRMIHTPGSGDGINPLPSGGTPSTIEYLFDQGGGWVSSGPIAFNTGEGGIPSNFNFNLGFGIQARGTQGPFGSQDEVPAVPYDVTFSNFRNSIPTPGAMSVLGLAGLAGLRRRR